MNFDFLRTPFLVTVALLFCFIISCSEQHGKCSITNGTLSAENSSLDDVLQQLSAYYNVSICNPKYLHGKKITLKSTLSFPLSELVAAINSVENDDAFLLYQNDVLYVSDKPFPKIFVPDKKMWPCK